MLARPILALVVETGERGAGAAKLVAPRIERACALALRESPCDVVVIGPDPAALVLYLEQQGERVTIIDASDFERARHLARESQDAIILTDLVERLPTSELRWLLHSCRSALRPGGVCALLSTERYASPRARNALRRDPKVNLFEIGALRAVVGESFDAVDAFTWNGTERFQEPGRADDLFAFGRAGAPYAVRSLPIVQFRASATENTGWITATVAKGVSLPATFHLRGSLYVRAAPADANVQFLGTTADPPRFLWAETRLSVLFGNPAELMLASELFASVGGATWQEVESIAMRIRSLSGGECDISVADLRLVTAD